MPSLQKLLASARTAAQSAIGSARTMAQTPHFRTLGRIAASVRPLRLLAAGGLAAGLGGSDLLHKSFAVRSAPVTHPPVASAGGRLDPATSARILATPKGSRPDPSTYMSQADLAEHRAQFNNGATRFMTESNLGKYGPAQRDGTSFVMPKDEADKVINASEGNMSRLENSLGVPPGTFSAPVVRIDIPTPQNHNVRMPSGNEAGANDQWIPGGRTSGGVPEAVVDLGGKQRGEAYTVTPVVPLTSKL